MTVKDTQLTETVAALTAAVAGHVRALRTARGWSLDELAGRSGVSKGMVVQIEAARTNPSVGTLVRIADAFGVTIARLLEPAEERTVRVSDAETAPKLWQGSDGGFGRLLRGMNDPSFVELWEWHFTPGERHTSENHMPGTREVLHVLEGTLTLTVDGTDHTVTAGQTIDFLADRPHTYKNPGPERTRLMMLAIVPNTEWDRRNP